MNLFVLHSLTQSLTLSQTVFRIYVHTTYCTKYTTSYTQNFFQFHPIKPIKGCLLLIGYNYMCLGCFQAFKVTFLEQYIGNKYYMIALALSLSLSFCLSVCLSASFDNHFAAMDSLTLLNFKVSKD